MGEGVGLRLLLPLFNLLSSTNASFLFFLFVSRPVLAKRIQAPKQFHFFVCLLLLFF